MALCSAGRVEETTSPGAWIKGTEFCRFTHGPTAGACLVQAEAGPVGSRSIIKVWEKVFMQPEGVRFFETPDFWTDARWKAAVDRAADGHVAT